MSNLEKRHFYLNVTDRNTFIDGDDLKANIIHHLSRVNSFVFNIKSCNSRYNEIDLSRNEDIQQSFQDFKYNRIISCVDHFQGSSYDQCGLFKCVYAVSLFDKRPFEHDFSLQIFQLFPFMKNLTINRRKAQTNERRRKSKNDDENVSIVNYYNLTELQFFQAHEDYLYLIQKHAF
ncbi:unnamed protein product [Rotaria socialis]|uniref:Uncharacterized protein n=1 Tax=Rotaria socialis TaxID=392032 RepID=A0A820TV78_9BILA|nr:unnamed protein product [Rotaria socialis]CAF3710993.1 unnamed protein product [Rotaria socialis]CAF4369523.1 unnamed protein product [Rotaria socialis]CAF4471801.1 unnamed protein product [Rotaria socialis]CAF4500244.1 unnamed protein product [Rotaria socialis]